MKVPFLYDDAHAIVENVHTWDPERLTQGALLEKLFHRPILTLTFALNRHFGNLDVFGYHLVNLWIHIAVGIVLFFLVSRLLIWIPPERRDSYRALPLFAALLHLVHPLNSQAVIYLSSRSSLLATLFFLLALYSWSYFLLRDDRTWLSPGGGLSLLLGFFFFFLGAGTKAIIVTLPLMALIVHMMTRRSQGLKMDTTLITTLLAPLFLYLVTRSAMMGPLLELPTEPASAEVSRGLYFLTQVKAFVFYYLLKWLIPVNLNFEPDFRLVSGFADSGVWLAGGVLLLLLGWAIQSRSLLVKFALLWTGITLAPTSSLIPLKQIVTEHRFYLPGLGMQMLLALFLVETLQSVRASRILVPTGMILLTLLTFLRGSDYSSAVTLWEDTAAKSPGKALVHNNLATAYLGEKRYEDAKASLKRTLERNPKSDHAHINLGFILLQEQRYEEALPAFYKAIELGTGDPAAYYNTGLALYHLDRVKESLPFLEEAVRLKPQSAPYRFDLAKAYQKDRRFDDALTEYRISLKIDPNNPKAFNNMGAIFWELKSFYFAEGAFAQSYQLDNTSVATLNNLISANMVLRQYDDAIAYSKRLLELKPDDDNARQMLAAAERLKLTLGSARPVH